MALATGNIVTVLVALAAVFAPAICQAAARTEFDPPRSNLSDPILLTDAPYARCLDGSPAAYYFRPYSAAENATKWVIYQQGGGWCTSIEDCYQRSRTNLGSSTGYAPTDISGFGGLLSSSPTDINSYHPRSKIEQLYPRARYVHAYTIPGTSQVNPMAADWNHVYLPYCDGASFSGANMTTEPYNTTSLHFRGFFNLQAIMADLLRTKSLANATDVVFTGCSAGGLATYLHADYISSLVPTATVVAAPDSGFFLDRDFPEYGFHYHTDLQWVFQQQNCTSGVNADCIAAQTPLRSTWKCMFAEHSAPYITTPLFPFQSQYDSWQVHFILGNMNESVVNTYGRDLSSTFMKSLNVSATAARQLQTETGRHANGGFLDSCFHHCGQWNNIRIEEDISSSALMKFFNDVKFSAAALQNSELFYFQNEQYKCIDCCGIHSLYDVLEMEDVDRDFTVIPAQV